MNLSEIQDLIKFVSKSGVNEVEIEQKDFKITIKSDGATTKRGKAAKQQQEAQAQMMQQIPMPMPQMPQQQMPMPQQPQQAPQQQQQAPAPQPAANEEKEDKGGEDTSKYVEIKSPMIGTFYRSPSPDKPEFVSVGDTVKEGDVVCIVEAMKLFNEIESEVSGKIVKVLVDDHSPIEYDQPLMLVDPS
ncbi:acetyl-CoA carboxylase biotin carboxyl carrier protein [Halocola ammonii]